MAKKSTTTASGLSMPTAVEKLERLPQITSGFESVLRAVFRADADLLAADSDEAKVEAKADLEKSKADYRKMIGDLNALVNGGALSGDERVFEAAHAIQHNGVDYAIGDPIPLNKTAFDGLKEVGAVIGNWHD